MKSNYFLLAGLAVSAFLVILIVARYRGDASANLAHLGYAAVAESLIAAVAIFVAWHEFHLQSAENAADASLGRVVGLACGLAWVVEISFNNFVNPRLFTASSRDLVDNGFWAFISLAILIASAVRSLRVGRYLSAVRVGLWSGLTSGLIACLMALLVITVWMRFLLRDPLNIGEYASRSVGEHSPNIAVYFAYETMAGAVGHLILLGIVMGGLLGAIGGLATTFSSRWPSRRLPLKH